MKNRTTAASDTPPLWRVPLRQSLQLKLFIPLLFGLILMVTLQVQLLLESHKKQQNQHAETSLLEVASNLDSIFSRMQTTNNHSRESLPEAFSRATFATGVTQRGMTARLLNAEGDVIVEADSAHQAIRDVSQHLRRSEPKIVHQGKAIELVYPVLNLTDCRTCHTAGKDVLGWLEMGVLTADRELVEKVMRRTGFITVVTLSIVFGLTIWALMFVHVRGPLSEMGTVMDQVMKGDLSSRIEIKSRDELARLGERFNTMVEQLEIMDEQLKAANLKIMMRAERMVGVGEMASRLAHEIRNPLAGIESVVSIFKEDLPEDSSERDILDETLQQIHRIENTLNDLLTFARPRPLRLEEIAIPELLNDLALFCRKSKIAEKHQLEVTCNEVVPFLRGDRDRLGQMFLNVMMNGLQIMNEPGLLNIVIQSVRDSTSRQSIEIRIRDTGPGIPKDAAPNVFKAFYTTRNKGTGLGLAISRSVAQQHGGTLVIGETGSDGTEFIFTIPFEQSIEGPTAVEA